MISLVPVLDYPGQSIPFLYRLLKERPPEANISHRSMPALENHKSFILAHPYTAYYLVFPEAKGDPVGSIYLTKQDEIGIAIAAEHARKGYAVAAIQALMKKHPRKKYLANIAPMNDPSHKLFQGMGFELIQMTYAIHEFSGGVHDGRTTG